MSASRSPRVGLPKTALTRFVDRHPFVPSDDGEKNDRCDRILEIQARGLARRMEAAYAKTLVIGLSGGLDSCLALLVAVRACEIAGRPLSDIHAVTMPCFGTTKRTKSNAETLAAALGTTFSDIDIKDAVDIHFRDIGHDPETHDVTYENCPGARAHADPDGSCQQRRRHCGRHGRPLRAGARLCHLQRRPHVDVRA